MQNIYGAPPPSLEEHHEVIEDIQKIVQGMQTQGYELEVTAQANEVITSSNAAVMAQLAHMNVTMNAMQAQLKTLTSAKTTKRGQKEISTAGVVGEISLMVARPDYQRNCYIKRERITKKDEWL